jgi:hypothetical protein
MGVSRMDVPTLVTSAAGTLHVKDTGLIRFGCIAKMISTCWICAESFNGWKIWIDALKAIRSAGGLVVDERAICPVPAASLQEELAEHHLCQ